MATFTFPIDSANKAGAVKATADGTDFYVPVVIYASDGTTQITSASPLDVKTAGSGSLSAALSTVTTAGTRVQLPSIPCREVTLIGLRGNTGYIYVGGADVSATVYGAELEAKDSVTIAVNNANLIYIDASVSGEGVSYVAI